MIIDFHLWCFTCIYLFISEAKQSMYMSEWTAVILPAVTLSTLLSQAVVSSAL